MFIFYSQVYISRDLTRAQRQELLRRRGERGTSGHGGDRPTVGGTLRRVVGASDVELAHAGSPSVAQLSRTFERGTVASVAPAPPISPGASRAHGSVGSEVPPPRGMSGLSPGLAAAGPGLRRSSSGNFLVRRDN